MNSKYWSIVTAALLIGNLFYAVQGNYFNALAALLMGISLYYQHR